MWYNTEHITTWDMSHSPIGTYLEHGVVIHQDGYHANVGDEPGRAITIQLTHCADSVQETLQIMPNCGGFPSDIVIS